MIEVMSFAYHVHILALLSRFSQNSFPLADENALWASTYLVWHCLWYSHICAERGC